MADRRHVLALALGLTACKSQARIEHEKLASLLDAPVKTLCGAFLNTEAGGCYRDCQTRLAAREGHAAWAASEKLAVVAAFSDPATEALLASVRKPARELVSALGETCSTPVPDDAPITPGVERCAEAERKARPTIAALGNAVSALAKSTKDRVGAELPSVATSCRER